MNSNYRWLVIGAAWAVLGGCHHEEMSPSSDRDAGTVSARAQASGSGAPSSDRDADPAFARALASDPEARTAFARFAASSVPALDACLGVASASRAPATAVVSFERAHTGDSVAPRYIASSFKVASGQAGATKLDGHGVACLDRLRGLPLRLPPAIARTAPRRFVRPVLLTMPVAAGGAR